MAAGDTARYAPWAELLEDDTVRYAPWAEGIVFGQT